MGTDAGGGAVADPPPADLLSLADRYREPMVRFLRDLVRIPSVNGRYNETAVAERVLAEARNLDLPAQLLGQEENRLNVLVQFGEGERGFALIGHLDTVAEGDPALWTAPPFEAEIHGDRMLGRGTADNKAGIACGLYTLALIRQAGFLDPGRHRVILAGVVDEESGASSPLGVRWLLDEGWFPVQGAIYTYASDVICIGHRGVLRVELRTIGQAVHSGSLEWNRGEVGVNAVTGLADVLLRLERLELPAPEHPAFPGLDVKVTPGTTMRGGDWEGMVPSWAEAVVDIRLMPDVSAEDILKSIDTILEQVCSVRPGLQIERKVRVRIPAAVISPEHPLVRIARCHAAEITGDDWPAVAAGPANEGYMLIGAGIPTLCGFGPQGGNAHAPNEWVDLESMVLTIAMYAAIIHDYLTREEKFSDVWRT